MHLPRHHSITAVNPCRSCRKLLCASLSCFRASQQSNILTPGIRPCGERPMVCCQQLTNGKPRLPLSDGTFVPFGVPRACGEDFQGSQPPLCSEWQLAARIILGQVRPRLMGCMISGPRSCTKPKILLRCTQWQLLLEPANYSSASLSTPVEYEKRAYVG